MEPSRIDHIKRGVMLGGAVGLCVGLVYGTYNIFRYGPGQKGLISTIGQCMAISSSSFAIYMGVGSGIRSEEQPKKYYVETTFGTSSKVLSKRFC